MEQSSLIKFYTQWGQGFLFALYHFSMQFLQKRCIHLIIFVTFFIIPRHIGQINLLYIFCIFISIKSLFNIFFLKKF